MLQKVNNIQTNQPPGLLTTFFHGESIGQGMIIDRFGKVRKFLEVKMNGYWKETVFHLDEEFSYDDGNVEFRNWQVEPGKQDEFAASCGDLNRPARGVSRPKSVVMRYRFPVPLFGLTVAMQFDDRMYQLDEDTIFERATMKKFGIRLADIYLVFKKSSQVTGVR